MKERIRFEKEIQVLTKDIREYQAAPPSVAPEFFSKPTRAIQCPFISVGVSNHDGATHKIPSNSPNGMDHFVTIGGRKDDILLQATINPDTEKLRNALTWKAVGAPITSPAIGTDRLTAKISRRARKGKKIKVQIKVNGVVCKEFRVWIIWSVLTGRTSGVSDLTGDPLGIWNGRVGATHYNPRARIYWKATIQPKQIITDADRPSIESQTRIPPPGANNGVPDSGNVDATGSGFRGWDMSQQRRRRTFKGNPLKMASPEPMRETNAADPQPQFRPEDYPMNDVQGNDDNTADNEDDNPYDHGPPPPFPGRGTLGTLRFEDTPRRDFTDSTDYNGNTPGEDGDSVQMRLHLRVFVRVQLGNKWYRCSDFGLWRWHMFALRENGQWTSDPHGWDIIDLTNDGFFRMIP